MAYLEYAKDLNAPVSPGSPFSLTVPGSEQAGRSATYRHWRFRDGILKSLDPNVSRFDSIRFEYGVEAANLD